MRTYERSWRWWVKEKKQMALVFIAIAVMMLQFQMKGCEGCLETERIGLLELKSYLNSLLLRPEEESILKSWSDDASSSDCCHWERVNCSDAIGGHVVDLSLNEIMPNRYMAADAPPPRPLNLSLLHSFPQLKTLDFSGNGFSHLFDSLEGVFPPNELANMTKLRVLNLSYNGFSFFSVKGYKSFQRLENLHTLDLSHNHLNNSVLPFLSAARSLTTLYLGFNRLEGVFPPNELANMTKLRVLNLDGNKFSFFSVKGLINLRELEVLDLSENRINDSEIVSFGAVLKDIPKLQELDLSENEFTDLDSLGLVFPLSLQVLNLKRNQLSSTPKGEILQIIYDGGGLSTPPAGPGPNQIISKAQPSLTE